MLVFLRTSRIRNKKNRLLFALDVPDFRRKSAMIFRESRLAARAKDGNMKDMDENLRPMGTLF